jgi:hypothetical protein
MGFYCRDCGKDVDEKQSDQTMSDTPNTRAVIQAAVEGGAMSDTPRTDKETGKSMGSDSIVYASFARQLERELTEAREQRDRLAEAMRAMWPFIEEDPPCGGKSEIQQYLQALAAVKGGGR